MSEQQPSAVKAWAQMQLGKIVFKVYQAKTAWTGRFGRKPTSDGMQADQSGT